MESFFKKILIVIYRSALVRVILVYKEEKFVALMRITNQAPTVKKMENQLQDDLVILKSVIYIQVGLTNIILVSLKKNVKITSILYKILKFRYIHELLF